MNRATRLLPHGYRCLLRLYPAPFRAEFDAEMEDVFVEAVGGVAAQDSGICRPSAKKLSHVAQYEGACASEWYLNAGSR